MGLFKRSREEYGDVINIANDYLMFLSRGLDVVGFTPTTHHSSNRVFECKTCSRQFPSFQALGGHRASHKRPRLNGQTRAVEGSSSPTKPKTHECSVCGLEFGIGQALGGHMRRHRETAKPLTLMKSKRIVCLDLNLTPLENDVEFRLGGKLIS